MATNRTFSRGDRIHAAATHPATVVSGNPARVGQIVGVALTDEDADGKATLQLDGVFDLTVKAIDGSGNSTVAIGDTLYYVDGDTPNLSKKDTGVRFGYAREGLASGATGVIQVQVGY